MASTENSKKRKKKMYFSDPKRAKAKDSMSGRKLTAGMRGFLITCQNKREGKTTYEAYNLFNEYLEKFSDIFPSNFVENPEKKSAEKNKEEDFEAELAAELKSTNSKKTERIFQSKDPGSKNCIFIESKGEFCNSKFVHTILDDLRTSQKQKVRFIQRLLPVEITCKAHLDEICKTLGNKIKAYFEDFPEDLANFQNFRVELKIRNNSQLKKGNLLEPICDVMKVVCPSMRTKLVDSDFVILIEIIQSLCCIGFAKEFDALKRYNPHEIISNDKEIISNEKEIISNEKEIISNEKEVVSNEKEIIAKQ